MFFILCLTTRFKMLLIVIICILQNLLDPSEAAPIVQRDYNTEPTVGWVWDGNTRGTFGLVVTCVLTLSLCVHSAVHLNIPPPKESNLQSWLRTTKWVLLGILGPELVIFTAWRQNMSARTLMRKIKEISDENTSKVNLLSRLLSAGIDLFKQVDKHENQHEQMNPKTSWTVVEAFYAGMGGFTIDREMILPPENEANRVEQQRLTLTARGVALLAECGYLQELEVNKEEIEDKNKADATAKLLSCLQALWVLVEVIGRLVQHLPVTLLEVNTLGHVLCAFVMYLLWWYKPHSIRQPTVLHGDWLRPLGAYMFISSRVSGQLKDEPGLLPYTWKDSELSTLIFTQPACQNLATDSPHKCNEAETSIAKSLSSTSGALSSGKVSPEGFIEVKAVEMGADSTCHSKLGAFVDREVSSSKPRTKRKISGTTIEPREGPTPMQQEMRALAAVAMQRYDAVRKRTKPMKCKGPIANEKWFEPEVEELLVSSADDWPSDQLLRSVGSLVMGMVLWFVSMAFGAVHVAAWNNFFPSNLEAWLWRSSALFICFSGALWLSINGLAHLFKGVDEYWERVIALKAHWTSYLLLGMLCTICGIAYICSRVFLVIEAFISIRSLPASAYNTPNWIPLIPHL